MSLRCGVVGLPNVGKSTIFNALTAAGAESANYPFCTIEPNTGIVMVPDERIDKLSAVVKPKETLYPVVEFLDIAGLVKGANKGEGLGNQFLNHIREVDAIGHVVRCFHAEDVVHVEGEIDPIRDIETTETELALKDLETLERRIKTTDRLAKSGDTQSKEQMPILQKVHEALNDGRQLRHLPLSNDERRVLTDLFLLTMKPVLFVCNVGESALVNGSPLVDKVQALADRRGERAVVISGKIEAEIAELDTTERDEFLHSLGLTEPGLFRLIHEAYELLGLISFFTAGPKEVRGWTTRRGATAPQAAGEIHSDFEKGFIRAEVINWEDFVRLGSEQACKDKGIMRVEGKDYLVVDGDVIYFRINV